MARKNCAKKATPKKRRTKRKRTPLKKIRHIHPFWFPPKMDDFWPIERLWAIMAQRVFRSPRPKTIAAVMRRVREECRSFDQKTLTKLIHELPAKMNEIRRLKGKKIPANFDPSKSPFACKCSICTSWFDNFQAAYPQLPTKQTNKTPNSCSSGVERWWWAKGRGFNSLQEWLCRYLQM